MGSIEASLQYVFDEKYLFERVFDPTQNPDAKAAFFLPDDRITQANPAIQRATVTNVGEVTAEPLVVTLTSENPYLNLFDVALNADLDGDGIFGDSVEFITEVNSSNNQQSIQVTILSPLLTGGSIDIDGLLEQGELGGVIDQMAFDYEVIDDNGNLVYATEDVHTYLSVDGATSASGSPFINFAPLQNHQGTLTIGGGYTDVTSGDDAVEALLPRIGGDLTDGHKLINLEFASDIDYYRVGTLRRYSDVFLGDASWAWYTPAGIDLEPFIAASGADAYAIYKDLLPLLADPAYAADVLTKSDGTFESQLIEQQYAADGQPMGNAKAYGITGGKIGKNNLPGFKTLEYTGDGTDFQTWYEGVAQANPNIRLKVVVTDATSLNFTDYNSASPLSNSELALILFKNASGAVINGNNSQQKLNLSGVRTVNEQGRQIGIKVTGNSSDASDAIEDDQIVGTDLDDELTGSKSDDELVGYSGNDIINTGKGKDVVWGGKGIDTIDLGKGGTQDILVLDYSDFNFANSSEPADIVKEFSKQDVIGLSGGLTYGTGTPSTDVYLDGNVLKVGAKSLAILQGFQNTLDSSNFMVKATAEEFFTVI